MKKLSPSALVTLPILALSLVLTACSSNTDDSGPGPGSQAKPNPNRVDWEKVSSAFNPRIEESQFKTDSINKINLSLFGSDVDTEIIYKSDLAPNTGILKSYTVFQESARWGNLKIDNRTTTLEFNHYGEYQCQIRIQNAQITAVKGGCYVRYQIILPTGSEIEVHSAGKLISRRFIPISSEEFLTQIDRASWADDKFKAIEEYLNSYAGLSKRPSLTAKQLGEAVGEFHMTEEKYKALKRLHPIVSNRDGLAAMIEDKFTYFDREEARRIVGL